MICATHYGNFNGDFIVSVTMKPPTPSEIIPIDGFDCFLLRQLFEYLHVFYTPVICTTHYNNFNGKFIVSVTTKPPTHPETLLIDGFHCFLLRKLL